METNDFDEIMRRKLDQATMPVSDGGWDRISSQLPVRVKRRLWPYYSAASVAAVALLLFILGDKYLSEPIPQDQLQVRQERILSDPHVDHIPDPLAVAALSKPVVSEKTTRKVTEPTLESRLNIASNDNVSVESEITPPVPENSDTETTARPEPITSPVVNQSTNNEEPYQLRIYADKNRFVRKDRGMILSLVSGNSPGASRGSSTVERTFFRAEVVDKGQGGNQILTPMAKTPMYYNHSMPIGFGLTVAKKVAKVWSIETGVMYTQLSSTFSSLDKIASGRQELHYIGVPLNLIGNFYQYKRLSLYGAVGGRVDINVYGQQQGILKGVIQETFSENVREKTPKFSFHLKVGASFDLIPHVQLFVEPGMGYYINNSSSLITIWKEYPLEFVLNLGIRTHF